MTVSAQTKSEVERSPDRWTTRDLEHYPVEEGKRYEIIEGELLVTTQPHWHHQGTSDAIALELNLWIRQGGNGQVRSAPGVLFDDENAVAPDVVWVSGERLPHVLGDDGKLHESPDLVAEVLSPGARNERRDREAKLRLYSQRGVREYWIADWREKRLEVYRRENAVLRLAVTLYADDDLTSPLLPGFNVKVASLFPK
ncbi:MAG: Uma2 family endonuclease [Chloroflexi bacterium]|nr:Uma2 family endonuclease [Chloroflexota bacterium]